MKALSRWLLAIGLLLSVSCASGDLGVLVSVEGWPVEALSMRVATSVDGSPRQVLQIPSGQDRFVVRLSPGESGELVLEATALDRGDCKVASGRLSISLGPSLHPTQTARLLLDRLPNILCTLSVEFTEGAGSVVSDPPGITCTSAGSCSFDFPSGTSVQLLPSFDARKQYVLWSGDCSGSAGCSLLMDRRHHLEVAFPGRICTPTGFCWQNPLPQGSTLSGVWVDPEGTAWMVGDNGTVLKCRGKSCTALASGATYDLNSLFGRGASEVWAVGSSGSVVKCSASSCARIPAGTVEILHGVWGSESGAVWAVGRTGTVVKCDANTCAPIGSVTMNRLRSVAGSDSGEVWAVGDFGTVLRCSGTSCTGVPSGTGSDLYAVWVSRSGQAWAVGDNGTILQCGQSGCSPLSAGRTDLLTGVSGSPSGAVFVHGVNGTLLKCLGAGCTPVATGTTSLLSKVWIGPGGEVWAAGNNGDLVKCSGDTCALLSSGRGRSFSWISGGAAGEVWAVGDAGTLVRCSGSKCLLLSSGELALLNTVYGSASGEVWAGGTRLIRCKDGSCMPIPRKEDTLISKIKESNGEFWAVGFLGTILKCSGSACIELEGRSGNTYGSIFVGQSDQAYVVASSGQVKTCKNTNCMNRDTVSPLTSVVGNSKEVWAGGQTGYIYKLDLETNQSTAVPPASTATVSSMWMSSSGEVWAVGSRSISKCSGNSCSPLPMVATDVLRAVWGSSSGEVWAVGQSLNVVRCTGTSCTLRAATPGFNLFAVTGDERGVAWAVGTSGLLLKCSGGTTCTVESLGISLVLRDLWIGGAGEVWIAGDNGAILRHSP